MKIEITIEVADERHPPPGASWATVTDNAKRELRSLVTWAERTHYQWENAQIVADGELAWTWELGRATENQIKQMRRAVVEQALNNEPGADLLSHFHPRDRERLGEDYKRVIEEYEAGAPWVKKVVSSVKASRRRREKQSTQAEEHRLSIQQDQERKLALVREIIKDEDLNQKVLESQVGTRIARTRIKEMVMARITGRGDFDPRPASPDEERLWGRIKRAVEVQAMFDVPPRFYGHIDDGRGGFIQISWDF